MLTNLTIYTINGDLPGAEALAEKMLAGQFVTCGPTQAQSFGWVPPRGEAFGALIEVVGAHWVAMLLVEKKILPASVVKRRLEAWAKEYEDKAGRKPAKFELKEQKETITLELLPQAFTKRQPVLVWIDPIARRVMIDTASANRAGATAEVLIEAWPTLNLHPLRTVKHAGECMTDWVATGIAPERITFGHEITLRGLTTGDEEAAPRISFSAIDVTDDDVVSRVAKPLEEGGMGVTHLSIVSERGAFYTLTGAGGIRNVTVIGKIEDTKKNPDAFDSNIALLTGALAPAIDDLLAALGGVLELPIEAAAGEAGAEEGKAPAPHDGEADTDPLYGQAVETVRTHRRASISLVQRYLRIGYNRAARLLDRMEAEGVVTPQDEEGNREVLTGAPT